jgi:capsular polysaccharide biosynthesis protein
MNNIERQGKQMKVMPSDAKEINLREQFMVIRRRLWVIVLITVIFAGIGSYYNSLPTTPLYQANTRIYLNAVPQSSGSVSTGTLVVMMNELIVMEGVIEELGLKRSAKSLQNQLSVRSIDGSQIINLSVIDSDPQLAAQIANTTVTVYKQTLKQVMNWNDVDVLSAAKLEGNSVPINPKTNRMLYISIIGGLILGTILAFILNSLDERIRSKREIERLLELPILGSVNKITRKDILAQRSSEKNVALRGETIGS